MGGLCSVLLVLESSMTPGALLWAHTVVISRAFTLLLGGRYATCMLPIIDMADHNPSARSAKNKEEEEEEEEEQGEEE